MRHNANTEITGPGAPLLCETHSARANLLGGLSIILSLSVSCFDCIKKEIAPALLCPRRQVQAYGELEVLRSW